MTQIQRISELEEPARAFISLGSNLGDSATIIRTAIQRLRDFSDASLQVSSLWRSSPIDCPPGAGDFINATVALIPRENETPESLLAKLQKLEREFGRKPKEVINEPRPLDLDLIAFGSEMRHTDQLTLPHPRALERCFVLEPLAEIAPQFVLPGQRQTVRELLAPLKGGQFVERMGNAK